MRSRGLTPDILKEGEAVIAADARRVLDMGDTLSSETASGSGRSETSLQHQLQSPQAVQKKKPEVLYEVPPENNKRVRDNRRKSWTV